MTAETAGRRLAIVNWRDPWHPAAGGAERYAWEIARRLAGRGTEITYLTCRAPGQARRETVEGVDFVRTGGRFTVYPLVLLWLLLHRRRFDAVLDCQNGIPFFTPWALPRRVPVVCVIHHVHEEQFGLYFPAWLAWVGRLLEGPVTRLAYRRHACTVVSPSTLHAVRERLAWRGPVSIVPNGVSVEPEVRAAAVRGELRPATELARGAGTGPQLVCVTRLVPHKQPHRLLDLAAELAVRRPGTVLHIVGSGPLADELADLVGDRGLTGTVLLHGFLSEQDKLALVAAADVHLSTSRGEGWGLSVVEAAALGVPTVAYDVEGLRDAVRDGITGWLVPAGDALADVVERALKDLDDPVRGAEITEACRRWAGEFDWARTAERIDALLAAAIRQGSSAAGADQAVVVRRYGDEQPMVAEGPVAAESAADPRAVIERPATVLERLLGRVDDGTWTVR